MADAAKVGTPWQDDELDAIVADYFAMLDAELTGRKYVKSHYSKALLRSIGRTHRSVEFKHQNISAALDELGLPWIPGYIPKRNYQSAILDAIDRHLSSHPELLLFARKPHPGFTTEGIFVDLPPRIDPPANAPSRMDRLVRKFDPVERDRRNSALGKAGEAFVFELEQRRLYEMGRRDLSREVRWTAEQDGDGAGFDVLSYTPEGEARLIEVKTTNGSARTPFFLTRNELAVAEERSAEWRIYRVHEFAQRPRIFTLAPPLQGAVHLTAALWQVSLR